MLSGRLPFYLEIFTMYKSTKHYPPSTGFSCAFRQWRADSHCRLIHGYALGFKFVFEAAELDVRNWVMDFGGLKPLKQLLADTFDHTTLVASDDPEIEWFREADKRGIIRLVEVEAGGCEKFAELTYKITQSWLDELGYSNRVKLVSVEVYEHESNSAIFTKE